MKQRNILLFRFLLLFLLCLLPFFLLKSTPTGQQDFYSTNNWYVGNTQAGEWIKFNRVWLSDGYYRFTARAVAMDNNQTVHLEVNGGPLRLSVPVPANEKDEFDLTHLGSVYLPESNYEIKLVFETGNVNVDMIFIKKHADNSTSVLPGDIEFTINREDGMHMAPIGGPFTCSGTLAKGSDAGTDASWVDNNGDIFSRQQMLTWYKQSIYAFTPYISDEAIDIYVSEQVEAKVDFIFCHGRGEFAQEEDVSITDRRYKRGIGDMGCRYIQKLVEAIQRSEYARDQLKIAYFVDNAPFHLASSMYFGEDKNWGDPEFQKFVWNYAIKTFYEMIPADMLFRMPDGSVPMQWWSANANYDYNVLDNKILEFFLYIEEKMLETFDLEVSYILDGTFFSRDPRTIELAKGQQAWFGWCGSITTMAEFQDKYYAFALNGGRLPITGCRLADWNPFTGEGTELRPDCHHSALQQNSKEAIRGIHEEGLEKGAEWLVLESWFDWQEGSTWYRSDHPEYTYPNQYIALTREFADRESGSIILEVEGCDEYHSLTKGNSGGAYRVNWYNDLDKDFWHSNKECDLNIYRPLHKLSPLYEAGEDQGYVKISAGLSDVWAANTSLTLYSQEVDGYPVDWRQVTPAVRTNEFSIGSNNVWAVNMVGQLQRTTLSSSNVNRTWNFYECENWQTIDTEETGRINKVALNLKEAFVLNTTGKPYYRDLSGKYPWQELPGENLKSITADEHFVWAMTEDNRFVVMSAESRLKWDTIANPYTLTQIDAAAGEVWGVNAKNEVYRINSSGHGNWQFVNEGFRYVTVGYEFVWLIGTDGKLYRYRMAGFESYTVFQRKGAGTDIRQPESGNYFSVKVTPNPFTDYLQADINVTESSSAILFLTTITGKVILQKKYDFSPGSNVIKIDLSTGIPQGIYLLKIDTQTHAEVLKVMKVN